MIFCYLRLLLLLPIAGTYQIVEYKTSLVTVRHGEGWIVNGYLNIVHVINLEKLEVMLNDTATIFSSIENNELNKKAFQYYLQRSYERINSIKGIKRSKRSIDWIGSAWKWVAGNPDAADWNEVLQNQEKLVDNNEHQYAINDKLFDTTNKIVKEMNNLISNFNNKISKSEAEEFTKESLNQLLIVKDDIEEIVRACQLAKSGIINTNLLDMEEIHRIISELETLPYNNEVEAIEYGKPSIFSNGTSLLYVLSIPKVNPKRYERITTRAAIIQNRQLDIKYSSVLLNHDDVYGINDSCMTISNTTICTNQHLKKLNSDDCLSRILRGIDANCTFLSNKETIVEQLEDDTIFVTNFKGVIYSQQSNKSLEGTFLIKYFNESIQIGNRSFTNNRITSMQSLPPLLANVYEKERKLDVNLLHELHERNTEHIGYLRYHLKLSFFSHLIGYLLLALAAGIIIILWRKIFGKLKLPATKVSEASNKEQV